MAFDINVRGRGAHAGVEPEKGLSAIKIASDIIAELPQGRIDLETTFNVATIAGGTVRNAVPSEASVTGEFRSMNMESLELLRMQLLTTVGNIRNRYQEAEITESLEMMFQMYRLDPNEATAQLVMRVMRDMGIQPNIQPSGGGTDGNVFRLNGIESVVVGMSTNLMHTIDEYVVIPDLMNTARFCEELMTFGS
jgi:tripeptide aminopeptidase